jgi:glutathione S-transferase
MALELYNFPASTCSQKVRICLHEKNLEWVDHILEARQSEHLTPAYLKLNPNGVVPTLVHDGEPVIESTVIVEYLDDIFPEPTLSPDTPLKIARMRSWLSFFEEVPTPAVRYPSFQNVLINPFKEINPEQFENAARRRPLRNEFYQRMGQEGFSDHEMNKALNDIKLTAERIENALSDGRPWIMGEQFTLADICVIPTFDRMEDLRYQYLWEDNHPNLTTWLRSAQERPSVKSAFYKGSRFSDIYQELELGKIGENT